MEDWEGKKSFQRKNQCWILYCPRHRDTHGPSEVKPAPQEVKTTDMLLQMLCHENGKGGGETRGKGGEGLNFPKLLVTVMLLNEFIK